MNFQDWYTDAMDIYRVVPVQDGSLTRQQRQKIAEGVRCRVYHMGAPGLHMEQTAARVTQGDYVQCGNEVDIRAGDELRIQRSGLPGATEARYFAGDPEHFYEPFGAVLPGLAHQEVRIFQEERVR